MNADEIWTRVVGRDDRAPDVAVIARHGPNAHHFLVVQKVLEVAKVEWIRSFELLEPSLLEESFVYYVSAWDFCSRPIVLRTVLSEFPLDFVEKIELYWRIFVQRREAKPSPICSVLVLFPD